MNLPNQSRPVNRSKSPRIGEMFFSSDDPRAAIAPSGWFCSPCKWAVGAVGGKLVGMGCTAGVAAFEAACNAALDVESGGLAAIPCTAAGIALGIACRAAGGKISSGMINTLKSKACSWAC